MNTICRVNSLAIHPNASTTVAASDILFTSKRSFSNIITNKNGSSYSNKNYKNNRFISNSNSNRSLKTASYKKNSVLTTSNNLFLNFVKSSLPINSILGNLQLNKCDKFKLRFIF
jgi:hypothetical protein